MRQKIIRQIQEKLKASYSAIAGEFDRTRKVPWEEFHHFFAYVRHGSKVLDLGCGNGRLFEALKGKKVQYLGVDHNSHLLEIARQNYPETRFGWTDIMDMNLEKEAFDSIFCIAAFHHIPGKKMRQKVVRDIHQTLKTDGVLILTVWNLFQWKYLKAFLRAILSFVLHLGFRYAWNDLWIRWGDYPLRRYYHAFLPAELLAYFPETDWELEEFYFTRKGNRVSFWRSFNLVLIVRKTQ